MAYPDKFTGFQVESSQTWQDFQKNEFQPKPFGDYDVDVKIECCGICGSDLHTIRGDWGDQNFPLTVGHGEYPPHGHSRSISLGHLWPVH